MLTALNPNSRSSKIPESAIYCPKNKTQDQHVLEHFKFRAVVDWMEFRVRLHSPSQFRHVQERMKDVWGKIYVRSDEGAASSSSFTFRLNDPPGPAQFMRDLQAIAPAGNSLITEDDVSVIGIEVALDGYIEGNDRRSLAVAVNHFLRHQAKPPSGPPRITARGMPPVTPTMQAEVIEAILMGDVTINSGETAADHRCRFYLKDYDTINGVPYAKLPLDQWRARFENTLAGSALPFKTIDGWRNCAFEKALADRFALVRSVALPDSLGALMQSRNLQFGRRPDTRKKRPSSRVQRRPLTRRDSAMNEKIRQALKGLTRSMRGRNSVRFSLTA